MKARVRLLGHSVHQSFVFLPLGLLTISVGCDVGYLITGDASWALMAYRLIAAGVITAIAAAAIGFVDWRGIPDGTRAKQVGKVHGLGNMVVVLLFAASWYFRRNDAAHTPGAAALIYSFAGLGLSGVTAWLGGELVSRLGVGVASDANVNAPSSLGEDSPGERARRDAAA